MPYTRSGSQSATSGVTLITDTTVPAGGSANVDLTSIAGTYKELMFSISGRSGGAVTAEGLRIRFNGDTAANYDSEANYAAGATAGAAATAAATSGNIAALPGASGTAGNAGFVKGWIPNYASTTFRKHCMVVGGRVDTDGTTTTYNSEEGYVNWRSTAAINRVTFFLGSGNNFAEGTRVVLWGVS